MDTRNIDKALEIATKLMIGEEIGKSKNASLYEEYTSNGEVYDLVMALLKKMNLSLYEYNYCLYVSPGENNHIFGYNNEELKREIGVRRNQELYLCYFIIYIVISRFYHDSANYTYVEYVKIEDIIRGVDSALSNISKDLVMVLDEVEENSFKTIAALWEDMPVSFEEEAAIRAARGSKSGFVKLVFNFLVAQGLMLETEGRYYPKERMKALLEQYFEEYKGRLHEIMKGEQSNAAY